MQSIWLRQQINRHLAVFLLVPPADLNLLRPPVCLKQTGTALLAREGEYQDDTSSTPESRLARRAATPAGRGPWMARVNPVG